MKTFIELYEALEKGDVEMSEKDGICDMVIKHLPEKYPLILSCYKDWLNYSYFRSFLQMYISEPGQWDSTRKNLLLLLACYDNEI